MMTIMLEPARVHTDIIIFRCLAKLVGEDGDDDLPTEAGWL